jgi:hypothetical protein
MGTNAIVPYHGPAELTCEMAARPVSDVLDDAEIERAPVIKSDVAGAEGSAVRGMAPMLGMLRADAEVTVKVTPEDGTAG